MAAGGNRVFFPDQLGLTVKERFKNFLQNFSSDVMAESGNSTRKQDYIEYIKELKERELENCIFVDYGHVLHFDEALAGTITEEFSRYESYLKRGVQEIIKEMFHVDYSASADENEPREFFVAFYGMPATLKVRDLKMAQVGALVAINGTVTRTSEVRPELLYGRFVCLECNTLTGPIEQQFKYTEPAICPNTTVCNNRSKFRLDVARSKFIDWQRVRVQENADEIPAGSMPRSVDVILRHSAVDKARAGDKCTFVGALIVVPDVGQLYKQGQAPTSVTRSSGRGGGGAGGGNEGVGGLKALGVKDLTYRTAFLAQTVSRSSTGRFRTDEESSPEAEAAADLTEDQKEAFRAMAASGRVYADLVRSLAPTIHGHTDIKKGILLMLLGGVHKRTPEGIKLRGDINVCIVGDPSTAKSQFLKYAVKFQPRAVYTSGKASSAAGLTASVVKDVDTGEFTIEAGALMLADNSICCIDEFDKMDPQDQVAIHEAMEQQTISITKAGIQATLNARTSILAAANPIFGRYDKTKTLRQNVAISPPIMSRFDMFFVVVDEPDDVTDELVARHIVNVHQKREEAIRSLHANNNGGENNNPSDDNSNIYTMDVLQGYVKYARTINPVLTPAAQEAIIKAYLRLRMDDSVGASRASYRITVRQLESVIRLSEALARIHLDHEIKRRYVVEAYTLLKKSIINVESNDIALDDDDDEDDEEMIQQLSRIEQAAAAAAAAASTVRTPTREKKRNDNEDNGGGGADAEDEEVGNGGAGQENDEVGGQNSSLNAAAAATGTATTTTTAAAAGSNKLVITSDKYDRMKRAFVLRLDQHESAVVNAALAQAQQRLVDNAAGAGGGAGATGGGGSAAPIAPTDVRVRAEDKALSVSALIAWYIEQQEEADLLPTVAALKTERKLARKVIKRLIHTDFVLVYPIDYLALPDGEDVPEEDRLVYVNPDYQGRE